MLATTSILICGGPRLWREALAARLHAESDLAVCGMVETWEHADEAERTASQLWILYGDLTGRDLSDIVACLTPHQRILIVGTFPVDADAPLAALASRRIAWTEPDAPLEVMLSTLRRLATGEEVGSPQLLAWLAYQVQFRRANQPSDGEYRPNPLTPREQEVAALVEEGLLNKQIARRLGIRVTTVKSHVFHLMRKLQVERRGNLVRRAGSRRAALFCRGLIAPLSSLTPGG